MAKERGGQVWVEVVTDGDGAQVIIVTSDTTFAYALDTTPTTPATGTPILTATWGFAAVTCTTTGSASTAVWTSVTASFPSSITFSGVITPTILAANTNNWAPTGFSTAFAVRMSSSSAISLTGRRRWLMANDGRHRPGIRP